MKNTRLQQIKKALKAGNTVGVKNALNPPPPPKLYAIMAPPPEPSQDFADEPCQYFADGVEISEAEHDRLTSLYDYRTVMLTPDVDPEEDPIEQSPK